MNRFRCLLAGIGLMFPAMAVSDTAAGGEAIVERLTRAFSGSYPTDARRFGKTRIYELVAAPAQHGIVPPYRTSVWAYNGQVPGPVFRITLGETVEVRFTNDLPQPTTIHWHGVRVPNAMDGVPGVTQAPVASGERFVYRFTPKDPGTYWYHPHLNAAEQVERGLHGVLIVEDLEEPRYSRDLVLVLDDWLLEPDATVSEPFVTRHDLAHDGRWGNVATVNGRLWPVLSVRAGERLRLRLINVANGRVFTPRIPELSPQVIAVDGMLTARPFALERFDLAPGNRIDLDLVVPESARGRRFEIIDTFTRTPIVLAALEVAPTPAVETPRFEPPRAARFPAWQEAPAAPLAQAIRLDAVRGGPYGISWRIDRAAWPDGADIQLTRGRFTRLRLVNESHRLHPMHLHGQFFRVLARDGRAVQEPFWRDTVLLGPKASVDIGLVPVDTGRWAHHCHILEHAEAGMMSVVRVKP